MGKLIKGSPVRQYFLDYRGDLVAGPIFQARDIESGIAVLESKSIGAINDFIEYDSRKDALGATIERLIEKHRVSLDILAQ